jgi:F420-non-reducing hydrogenase iron-sulfur subunit
MKLEPWMIVTFVITKGEDAGKAFRLEDGQSKSVGRSSRADISLCDAGVSRMQYPPNVVDIRVMCTGTITPHFVLKAFQEGIDGVLIAGCHIGDCHYGKGNYMTAKRFRVIKDLLAGMGIDPRRIRLEWVSAAEGAKFQDVITSFTEQVRAAGKSPLGV